MGDSSVTKDSPDPSDPELESDIYAPPDGGWGWVVMCASFVLSVIVDGVCFSFGLFYLEFLNHFGASKSKTAWVGSVLNGMYMCMGPPVGVLVKRFGGRPVAILGSVLATMAFFLSTFSPNIDILILTYGAMAGMSFGLMYLPAIVMVGFYFEKKKALATGVAVCGSGIGGFLFAPMSEKLIETYGWRGATWIIAGIVLNGAVASALFRPLPKPTKASRLTIIKSSEGKIISNTTQGNHANSSEPSRASQTWHHFRVAICEMFDISLIKDPVFAIYGLSCFLCMTGFFVPFTYLPDYAIGLGISRDNSAFLLSIIGIANTVARVGSGWISDQSWADCLLINNLALVIGGAVTICCPWINNYRLLAAYSGIFGACIAVFVTLRSIIAMELLCRESLTKSFGIVTLCQGLGTLIGAPAAGAIFDLTNNYNISFYVAGGTLVLSGVICLPLRRLAAWRAKRKQEGLGKARPRSSEGESLMK